MNDIVTRMNWFKLMSDRNADITILRCIKTETASNDVISLQVVLETLKLYPWSFKKNLLLVTIINS